MMSVKGHAVAIRIRYGSVLHSSPAIASAFCIADIFTKAGLSAGGPSYHEERRTQKQTRHRRGVEL